MPGDEPESISGAESARPETENSLLNPAATSFALLAFDL